MHSPLEQPVFASAAVALLAIAAGVFGELTSETHPGLARISKEHAEADRDKDGILTYAEYKTLYEAQDPKKRKTGSIPSILANGDILIADFEDNNLSSAGWRIEGEAFKHGPAMSARIMKRRVGSYRGKYFLSSLIRGDEEVGEAASPLFEIELKYIEFLISGGQWPGQTCVNLVVDDQVVRTACGRNDDYFELVAFDVSEFQGRQARLKLVDRSRGIWGHLNVDRVYQTARLRGERVISEDPDEHAVDGLIQTVGARIRGKIKIIDGQLTVDKQVFALEHLLTAVCQVNPGPATERHVLQLVNGERWRADILKLENGRLLVTSPLFGQRSVPLPQVASMAFRPDTPAVDRASRPGTLYRTEGDPIPGKLVWVREKDIAIECILGVVPVPRDKVRRIVLSTADPVNMGREDEVGLVNGSVLRGTLSLDEDKLVLEHPVLGSLRWGWQAVKYVRRMPRQATWMEQWKIATLEQTGPVASPPPPAIVRSTDHRALRAVRMMPRTVAGYEVPSIGSDHRTLRGVLSPVPGCRADMKVNILVDGKSMWQRQVSAAAEPLLVAIKLPRGSQITVSVDFDGHPAFPCGVDWWDAHVLAEKATKGS